MKPGTRPMIRISAALATFLGYVGPEQIRSVEVQRVPAAASSHVNAGRRRRAASGDRGVYRGGLFRKTTIRDMMARAVASYPNSRARNTAKRYRQGRVTWAEAFGPAPVVDKRIARPIAGVST